MDRPTFSESWSRVSRLTPTLRPQVQITRQLFRGQPWHVVHDPVSNNFFRLNPVAYHLVGLLDGKRSVDEVWRMTLDRYGDAAPTQHEVIGLLSQLNGSNLLRADLPPDAEPLLARQRRRKLKHWGGQAMSILFFRMPIFNPDRMLTWLTPLFKPILNKWGMMAWVAWILFVLWQFLPHLGEFLRSTDSVLAPNNWGWIVVLFILTKAIHELGHGLICKRFGGLVPEVGIMLLVLFPVPYVDATSSWNFPDKWKRLLVGAAGMVFELAIAGIGALIWARAEPNTLARQLSYNVVFLASVTTILFNANPLLRFDGYYMLSDFLEIPNLYSRAQRQLQYLVKRYAYGMTNTQPISSRAGEKTLLTVYGITSQIYKVFILFGIVLFVAGKMFTLGLLFAAWSIIAWGLVPLGKLIHWLATGPALHEHRVRAVTVTIAFVAITLGSLGFWPATDHRRAVGVVECTTRADLAVQTEGFVTEVHAKAGEWINAGDIVLVAENPELSARHDEVKARLKGMQAAYQKALASEAVDLKMSRAQIEALEDELNEIEIRLNDLVLKSPIDGVLVGTIMSQWVGQYAQRGDIVARIKNLNTMRVTAVVDQAQNAALFDPTNPVTEIEIRLAGQLSKTLPSSLVKAYESGREQLPHRALGYAGGGGIATDPQDNEGQSAMHPQFELWLELPQDAAKFTGLENPNSAQYIADTNPLGGTAADEVMPIYPGQRAYARFALERKKPLLAQWWRSLRQVLRDRLLI